MSVLQRSELEDSPLADLHAIASELGVEGYRALRRSDLVTRILQAQDGDEGEAAEARAEPEPAESEPEPAEAAPAEAAPEEAAPEEDQAQEEAEPVTGILDVLGNGNGFLRVGGGGQSRDDVYVSPAQIRRCELRAGDEVAGPLRPARRSERHPSLVHVETVNGRPAEPPEERPDFDALTPVHPTQRVGGPPSLEPVPFGLGSRVAIAGGPGAGATRLLREVVSALQERHPEVGVTVVLAGARPEEVTDWRREAGVPVTGGAFDGSQDAQAQVAELAIERAKRLAERGGDAAVVIDSLEAIPSGAARRIFGAARKLEEGGSVTVIAATGMAWEAQRQASTRIALDAPGEGGEPRVSASRSGTLRADLL